MLALVARDIHLHSESRALDREYPLTSYRIMHKSLSVLILLCATLTTGSLTGSEAYLSMVETIRESESIPYFWDGMFLSLEAAGGVALATSSGSNDSLLRSTDGMTWEVIPFDPIGSPLVDLAFGNGVWLALGHTFVLRSTDQGNSWEEVPLPRGAEIYYERIEFVRGFFVIWSSQHPVISVSAEGKGWNMLRTAPQGVLEGIYEFPNGAVTGVTRDGLIYATNDLFEPWQLVSGNRVPPANYPASLSSTFSRNMGRVYFPPPPVLGMPYYFESKNGWDWEKVESRAGGRLVHADETYYLFNHLRYFSSSHDRDHWTDWQAIEIMGESNDAIINPRIKYLNGTWLASFLDRIYSAPSPSGPWAQTASSQIAGFAPAYYHDCIIEGDTLIAVGTQITRMDLPTRQETVIPLTEDIQATLHAVIWDGNRFVASGSEASVLTSPNGNAWNRVHHNPEASDFISLAYGDGVYLVSTADQRILKSSDLLTWEESLSADDSIHQLSVTYVNGRFFTLFEGFYSRMKTSLNGSDWEDTDLVAIRSNQVIFHNNQWIAGVYAPANIAISSDGLSWEMLRDVVELTYSTSHQGLAYGNSLFIGANESNTPAFSLDGHSWHQDLSRFYYLKNYPHVLFSKDRFYFWNASGSVVSAKITTDIPSDGPGVLRLATNPAVTEEGSPTWVRVTREGGIEGAVSVTLSTTQSGTATPGTHYSPQSIILEWKDGETGDKRINTIETFANTLAEGIRTIGVQLSNPTGGARIVNGEGFLHIRDNPFDGWRFRHFPEDPEGEGHPLADPDGDGIPNYIEYLLGMDPGEPDRYLFNSRIQPAIQANGVLWFPLIRTPSDSRLHISLEKTQDTDLASWIELGTLDGFQNVALSGGYRLNFIRIINDASSGTFFRLLFEYEE